MTTETIDTTNDFMVGVQGDTIVIYRPPLVMTKAQALRLAAYLVALADDNEEFISVLGAVRIT